MPDISMCCGKNCDVRMDCYRFRAVPSNWQSYASFDEADECNRFVAVEPTDRVRSVEEMEAILAKAKEYELTDPDESEKT